MSELPIQSTLTDMLASVEQVMEIHKSCESLAGPAHANANLAAILYNLIIIGEAAIRLGEDFHSAHPDIPWRQIIDNRNHMAHGYDTVDEAVLNRTITQSLPTLADYLRQILKNTPPNADTFNPTTP